MTVASVREARVIKKRCDGLRWYGRELRVEYQVHRETPKEVRDKYAQRSRWVKTGFTNRDGGASKEEKVEEVKRVDL